MLQPPLWWQLERLDPRCISSNARPALKLQVETQERPFSVGKPYKLECTLSTGFPMVLQAHPRRTKSEQVPVSAVWRTKRSTEKSRFRPSDGFGPRQSLRSGSRSDSFWGSRQGGCTEMHYSPGISPKRGT